MLKSPHRKYMHTHTTKKGIHMHTPQRKTYICTHLVKEVVDSKLVVIEQNLLFCSEEPLA